MRIATRDRLWLLGGLVAALLLVLLAWQFFVKTQHDQTNSVKTDITSANQQVLDSTHQLNQLRADNVNLGKYKAALASGQQALPVNTAMPEFIRELQSAGDLTGIKIIQLQSSAVQPVPTTQAGTTPIYDININLIATGAPDNLTAFLHEIQTVQPRAVLVSSVTQSPGSGAGSQDQLTVVMAAFVEPADGKAPAAS